MKTLVLLSGGMDSAVCLAAAVSENGSGNVTALSVFYGQKHSKELEAARKLAAYYNVTHIEIDLAPMFEFSDCSLLSGSAEDIPAESYAEQLERTDGKPVSTYVPFRNGLFLSAAASIALSRGCGVIMYGAHSDDAAGSAYPDCSPAFNRAMSDAVREGTGGQLVIDAPFVNMTKADVVKRGLGLNVPFEMTWSCYAGGERPCGVCGTCRDRAAAFAANGIPDPALK